MDGMTPADSTSAALLDRFHLSRVEFERKHLATLTALGLPAQVAIYNQSIRELADHEQLKAAAMLDHLRQLRDIARLTPTPKPRRARATV